MAEQSVMPDPMATEMGDAAPPQPGSNAAPLLPYHDLRQWLEEAKKLGLAAAADPVRPGL